MAHATDAFIVHRLTALATVSLTRRRDLVVDQVKEDYGYDLIVRITSGGDPSQVKTFGVILKATTSQLGSEPEASRELNLLMKGQPRKFYPFPLLVLLFSMEEVDGYYAWLMEPSIHSGNSAKLTINDVFRCKRFLKSDLDKVVSRVEDWYEIFFRISVVHA